MRITITTMATPIRMITGTPIRTITSRWRRMRTATGDVLIRTERTPTITDIPIRTPTIRTPTIPTTMAIHMTTIITTMIIRLLGTPTRTMAGFRITTCPRATLPWAA